MRLVRLLATCCAVLAVNAHAQFLSFRDVLSRPDRPQPDHKIAYAAGPQQYGELWLPKTGAGPHPVVLMIHGGCWRADLPGPELLAWQADAIRAQGIAVWSITYRRLGHESGGYPGTFQDVAAGADHLRSIAGQYKLDLGRVVTTGHSAGGHLALWLPARKNLPASSPLKTANPLAIHGAVPVAGVGDLAYASAFVGAACGADTITGLVKEKERGKDAWADTSPAALLPLGIPQTMISGMYDAVVAPAHARRHQMLAERKGDSVKLLTLDESAHFEIISPWTGPGKSVVDAIVAAVKALPK
ncbi:MAG: alpha/beta hydrolase [Betaproteobacteria bacterium]|nr:alpha/beta hydrolase [Betaproteobacteria bacterium]